MVTDSTFQQSTQLFISKMYYLRFRIINYPMSEKLILTIEWIDLVVGTLNYDNFYIKCLTICIGKY